MNSKSLLHAVSISLMFATMTGCNPLPPSPNGTGPIDGTWIQTGGTCNGQNEQGFSNGALTISDLGGSYSSAPSNDGCISSDPFTLTYPASGSLTMMTGTRQCSAACSGADQSNAGCGTSTQPSPWTVNYSVSGKILTLTFTNSGCSHYGNANDVGSDTEVATFTQQLMKRLLRSKRWKRDVHAAS